MVRKRKRWKLCPKLLPKAPDLEAVPRYFDIVQEYHSTWPHFRKPSMKVVRHRIVCMQTVDMKHIKTTIFKLSKSLIESHSKEFREGSAIFLIVLVDVGEDLLSVEAGVFITRPRIDGIASAVDTALDYRLTKTEVGLSVMRAQLHHGRRTKTSNQIASEW